MINIEFEQGDTLAVLTNNFIFSSAALIFSAGQCFLIHDKRIDGLRTIAS
jgi:hypothetical protein